MTRIKTSARIFLSFMIFIAVSGNCFVWWNFVARAEAETKTEPFAPEQLATKNTNVTQCTMAGNVPVMGFDLKVVCLEPSGKVAWIR